jgi:hypothetical protein
MNVVEGVGVGVTVTYIVSVALPWSTLTVAMKVEAGAVTVPMIVWVTTRGREVVIGLELPSTLTMEKACRGSICGTSRGSAIEEEKSKAIASSEKVAECGNIVCGVWSARTVRDIRMLWSECDF